MYHKKAVAVRIIFHADDCGATKSITDKIIEAWDLNILDSFSILANGLALNHVNQALRSRPLKPIRLAAHLNFFDGKSRAKGIEKRHDKGDRSAARSSRV